MLPPEHKLTAGSEGVHWTGTEPVRVSKTNITEIEKKIFAHFQMEGGGANGKMKRDQ